MDSNAPVTSWDFMKENYRPQDRIAIVIRNRAEDYTLQRLLSALDARLRPASSASCATRTPTAPTSTYR